MSIEIEAKMRIDDPEAIRATLAEHNAERISRLDEENIFFDSEQRALRAGDRGLRVRVEHDADDPDADPRCTMTYKGPRAEGPVKTRQEIELTVSSADGAAQVLGELGYREVLRYEKHRERWSLDGCLVELDELPRLGHFMEIEGPTREAVLALRHKLGFDALPLIRASYPAMLAWHLSEAGDSTRVVRFADDVPAPVSSNGRDD